MPGMTTATRQRQKTISVPSAALDGGMTLSPNQRDACLASHTGLLILDLAQPTRSPHIIHAHAVVPASEIHWSSQRETLIAATANRLALVVDVAASTVIHALEAHARALTDLHWAPVDPNLLATAALDARVHLWDLRSAKRPAVSFSDARLGGGVTQVLYNRRNEFVIASAHAEGAVCIWDTRKGSRPSRVVRGAHTGKVNGFDWSPKEEYGMVTCGQDRRIRVWDLAREEVGVEVRRDGMGGEVDARMRLEIVLPRAARRARYTPFGNGIASMAMPTQASCTFASTVLPGVIETSGYMVDLWSITKPDVPVYSFEGHKEAVKEFLWRDEPGVKDADKRRYDLVTWSLDGTVRITSVEDRVYESVNYCPPAADASPEFDPFLRVKSFWKPSPKTPKRHAASCERTDRRDVEVDGGRSRSSTWMGNAESLGLATPGPMNMVRFRRDTDASIESKLDQFDGTDGWKFRRSSNASTSPWTPGKRRSSRAGLQTPATPGSGYFFQLDDNKSTSPLPTADDKTRFPDLPDSPAIQSPGPTDSLIKTRRASSIPKPTFSPMPQRRTGSMTAVTLAEQLLGKRESVSSPLSATDVLAPPWLTRLSIGSNASNRSQLMHAARSSNERFDGIDEVQEKPWHLEEEMDAVKRRIPSIRFENVEVRNMPSCDIILESPWVLGGPTSVPIRISLLFPHGYPSTGIPAIATVVPRKGVGSNLLSPAMRRDMTSTLAQITSTCASQQFPCIEPIARYILGDHLKMEESTADTEKKGEGDRDDVEDFVLGFGRSRILEQDPTRVPFPRFCGAVFIPDGRLVTFFRSNAISQIFRKKSAGTRRAEAVVFSSSPSPRGSYLQEISEGGQPRTYNPRNSFKSRSYLQRANSKASCEGLSGDEDISYHFSGDKSSIPREPVFPIVFKRLSVKLPMSKDLAKAYVVSGHDSSILASKNAMIAASCGRKDLVKMWMSISLMLRQCVPRKANGTNEWQNVVGIPKAYKVYQVPHWGEHPFGPSLIRSFIDHCLKQGDVQTVAVLSCLVTPQKSDFGKENRLIRRRTGRRQKLISMPQPADNGAVPIPPAVAQPQLSELNVISETAVASSASKPSETGFMAGIQSGISQAGVAAVDLLRPKLGRGNSESIPSPPSIVIGPSNITSDSMAGNGRPRAKSKTFIIRVDVDMDELDFDSEEHPASAVPLLPLELTTQMDACRLFYAECLYRWKLDIPRADVLKFVQTTDEPWVDSSASLGFVEDTLEFGLLCQSCGNQMFSNHLCPSCRGEKKSTDCVVCHLPAKGIVNFCLACCHGGHTAHIMRWFSSGNTHCATGCGCHCLAVMENMTSKPAR